ncbi:heat shock protein 70 family [Diaporthe sp. PMI_573]|nr:heat shock protein 70 family [Diaporthaceae sp. PMI_573]
MRNGTFDALYDVPSCVAFTDQGVLVGEEAKAQRPNNPSRTICDVRMLLGQRWSDPQFQETIQGLHYRVVQGEADRPVVTVDTNGREYKFTPEDITGRLMAKLRDTAAGKIGEEVGYAVVAVPLGFNDHQRQAVKDAGATIGLEVVRVVNEYVAAVVAYGLDMTDGEANFIVMDLGASKTDITVVYIDEGVMEALAMVSEPTFNRTHNRRLVNYIAAQCATEGVLLDQQAQIELEDSIELAQKNRSFGPSAYCLRTDSLKHCTVLLDYTREDSSQDSGTTMSATVLEPLKRVLVGMNMSIEWQENSSFLKKDVPYIPSNIGNVDKVIVVGGFSKSPMVAWLLNGLQWNGPSIDRDLGPEEAVLKGTAIMANILSGDDGTSTCYFGPDSLSSVGLETSQGYMHKAIRRYTPIPSRRIQNFTTAYDNQESMLIRVFEGERMMARDNVLLGELELTGIPRAPRHVPIVEVSFELDANNILKVDARCLNTTIEASAIFMETSVYNRDPNSYTETDQEQEFGETDPDHVYKGGLERYIEIVERTIPREDVIDAPLGANDFDLKKEAEKIVRETKEWLATESDTAPSTEFNRRKSKLWDVMHDLLHYNPPGRMYTIGPGRLFIKHGEL